MANPTHTVPPAPVPGFIEIVDAEIARIDAFVAACFSAFVLGFAHAQAQEAQRPTLKSACAMRHAAHVAGLPVVGGAR